MNQKVYAANNLLSIIYFLVCIQPALFVKLQTVTKSDILSILEIDNCLVNMASINNVSKRNPTQAIPAKIFHWINIVSLSVMLTSGLQIYNANPVFGGRGGLHIPPIFTLGGWLAGGRHWHFTAMWLFSLNLLWYGIYVLITRRWQHRFVSSKDLKALQKTKNPKRLVYAWHRIAYTSIIPILLLALFTGIGMYKPAQFPWIVSAFGSWQALRIVHFSSVPLVVLFAAIHSWLGIKAGGEELTESMFW